MKRQNLLFCASLLSLGVAAQENNVQILVGPDVLVEYQMVNMSANGRWACGNVNDGEGRGFLWDIVNNEITQVAPIGQTAPVLDVSDNGTLVGLFTTTEATANGASLEMGGYFKDGRWHYLPECGIANGISDNGLYIAGTTYLNGDYRAATWTLDGEMTVWSIDNVVGGGYDVTNDGQKVCGFANHPIKNNRTPAMYALDATTARPDTVMLDSTNVGPFSTAWNFSPDGSKISADMVVYDVNTGVAKPIDFSGVYDAATHEKTGFVFGHEFFRVSNKGNLVGHYTGGSQDIPHAAYVLDGKIYDLQNYLEVNYNIDFQGWQLLECTGISEDEMIFAVSAYDTNNVPRPIIINLKANLTNPAPTSLKAVQMEGTSVCRLTWKAPLANVAGVKAYRVWRNGEQIAELSPEVFAYYDQVVANGNYEYVITALYEGSESDKSQSVSVEVGDYQIKAPRHLTAVQAGLCDVRLFWKAPLANRPALKYGSAEDNVYSFGGGDYSFEQAVRFDVEDLAVYDKQVTDITFYPMSRQNSWTVNFYTAKDTALFHTEVLDDSHLVYGVENTVRLKTPVALPEGEDIYVGILVDVTGIGGYQTLGAIFNKYKPGYTDLLRRVGEDSFMSLYENAMNNENGAYEYPITFPIGMCFGDDSQMTDNDVVSYKIYADGVEVSTSGELKYRMENMADGEHRFGIVAVYGNGLVSAPVETVLEVTANTEVYKAINPTVTVGENGMVSASWETPMNDDETYITYAGNTPYMKVAPTENEGYSCLLAAKYDSDKLGNYEGYQITDLKFYPTSDADFILYLQENGQMVGFVELPRETNYVKNTWNTYKLEEPVVIKDGAEYTMVVDVWQVTPGEAPLAMDGLPAFENESDLYSSDGGVTYTSLCTSNSSNGNGNWMMGLIIREPEAKPLPVVGYNVVIDRKQATDSPLTENAYTQQLKEGAHTLRVDVLYEGLEKAVTGSTKLVVVPSASESVEVVGVETVVLEATDTQIKVVGGEVSGVKMYDMAGRLAAQTEGDTLDVSHVESGIYLLTAVVDGQEVTRKVSIK